MAQPKLILGFDRLSDPNLLAFGGAVVAAMKDNAAFPSPWGDNALTWDGFNTALVAYRDAYNLALSRDVQKISRRNAARQTFVDVLRRVGAYVEFRANGNRTMLASSGFELRQQTVRGSGSAAAPGAMAELRAVPTEHSGRIHLRAGRAVGAKGYEVQTRSTDPSAASDVEGAGWSHAQTVFTVQSLSLDGLPAGYAWVRMRGANGSGYGPWSTPVRVLVT